MRRFVAANDRAGETGDWEPLGEFYAEDAIYTWNNGAEARVRRARARRDPPLRVRHRDGRPREVDLPLRARADRRPEGRGDRRLAPDRAGEAGRRHALRDRRHRRLLVPLRRQLPVGLAARLLRPRATPATTFIAMAKDGKLSEEHAAPDGAGLEDAGLGAALRVRLVRDAPEGGASRVFTMRFDMRAPEGGAPPAGALPRRARDGGVGRGARLPRARGVGAPRLAGRLPAGAARARGGARGPHPAPADPGRGADPPAPRPDRAGGADGGARPRLGRAASPTCSRSATAQEEYAMLRARLRRARAPHGRLPRGAAPRVLRRALRVRGPPGARAAAPGDARRAAAAARRREPRGGAPRGALRPRHGDPGRRPLARRALPRRVRASRPRAGRSSSIRPPAPSPRPSSPRIRTRPGQRLGPYLLHDARMYAAWLGERRRGRAARAPTSVAELRAESGPYRIFTPEEAVAHVRSAAACCCSSRSAAGSRRRSPGSTSSSSQSAWCPRSGAPHERPLREPRDEERAARAPRHPGPALRARCASASSSTSGCPTSTCRRCTWSRSCWPSRRPSPRATRSGPSSSWWSAPSRCPRAAGRTRSTGCGACGRRAASA